MAFDLPLARACLEASSRAYAQDNPGAINTKLAHALVVDSETDRGRSPSAAATFHDARIIAFRGSANLRDWLTDGTILRERLPDRAEIHLGFYTAYQSIADRILTSAAAKDGSPIYLTGHSLGGALAVLAAWHLARHFIHITGIYTFGQPRVGDPFFASDCQALFGEKHYRLINDLDLVPRLPALASHYRHSGHRVYITGPRAVPGSQQPGHVHDPRILVDPSPITVLAHELSSLYHAWRTHDYFDSLQDHSLAEYQSALAPCSLPVAA